MWEQTDVFTPQRNEHLFPNDFHPTDSDVILVKRFRNENLFSMVANLRDTN